MSILLIQADARQIPLADQSVNCCVTSPPYWNLRNYKIPGQLGLEKTPEEYVSVMVDVFREVKRVLRNDGTLWLNMGDSYLSGISSGRTRETPETGISRKPEDLVKPCILAGCPPGGIVLDPFVGSGTTALVARDLQCKAIGIDLNPKYLAIAQRRLAQNVMEFV